MYRNTEIFNTQQQSTVLNLIKDYLSLEESSEYSPKLGKESLTQS